MFNRRHVAKKYGRHLKRETYANGIVNSWWSICEQVKKRDNNKCFYCGAKAEEVHHIIPLSRGGTTTMVNLVCVCKACHNRLHSHMKNRKI